MIPVIFHYQMVFFVPFVSVFIYDWKAHISFFPYVPFLCSSTVFFPSFLSIFCFSTTSTTTLLLAPSPLTNFLLLHSPFYTRETYYNSSFLDLFLQGEKQLLAWPKYLDFLGQQRLLMKRNLTSWALIQKSSGQVQRAPSSFPTLLATMHFGSQPWSLPFLQIGAVNASEQFGSEKLDLLLSNHLFVFYFI